MAEKSNPQTEQEKKEEKREILSRLTQVEKRVGILETQYTVLSRGKAKL